MSTPPVCPRFDPSRVTLGTWPMGGDGRYGDATDDMAMRTIAHAVDLGITSFDTAPGYGSGHAEELLGRALQGVRSAVLITTKVGAGRPGKRDSSPDTVRREIEASLGRLRTDYVDAYLVHWPDDRTPVEVTMEALDGLVAEGLARFVGVSNFDRALIQRCQRVRRVDVVQVGYNLFDRRMEQEVIPYCRDHGIVVMGYGSLAHGLLSGSLSANVSFPERDWRSRGVVFGQPLLKGDRLERNLRVVDRLRTEVAEPLGLTLPRLAMSWVLSNPVVATALVGACTAAEIEEDVAVAELGPDTLGRIDAIMEGATGRTDVFRPFGWAMAEWEPTGG